MKQILGHSEFITRASAYSSVYAQAAGQVLLETIWPTRCALCDEPGHLLCDTCRSHLPFIDQWQACGRCGAPWGVVQCTECSAFALRDTGRKEFPFTAAVCSCLFDDNSGRIVGLHKDAGERGLAKVMAFFIASAIPPAWITSSVQVTYVPATYSAFRRRGFDHGREIAEQVAGYVGMPCTSTLARPRSLDQRCLSRAQRQRNMRGRFRTAHVIAPCDYLLIDDVMTTGATAAAATDALMQAGALSVRVATFARVY